MTPGNYAEIKTGFVHTDIPEDYHLVCILMNPFLLTCNRVELYPSGVLRVGFIIVQKGN